MLIAPRARSALEGLPAAARLLSSTGTLLSESGEGGQGGSARVRGTPAESYGKWGQQVYQRNNSGAGQGRDGEQQHAAAPGHQQQRQEGPGSGGGGGGGGGDRDTRRRDYRNRHPDQHQHGKQFAPRRQDRDGKEAGFRANFRDPRSNSMGAAPYVRMAPREGQRQHDMWPAYMFNTSPALLRQDIASFFDGYNLSENEIRPEFAWGSFEVERFWLNFGSRAERERAMSRHMAYLGTRRVLLRKALPYQFTQGIYNPLAMSSRGRYLLVTNLATTCTSEDVIRFFSGYDLHAKSVSFLRGSDSTIGQRRDNQRRAGPGGGASNQHMYVQGQNSHQQGQHQHTEKAIVRFSNQVEAHRALRDRQGGFCGNNQVQLRVMQ